jgi:phosphatidylserine/phosphatidylglycerophosphate/cardiolipin synthase-like enzyme
VPPWVTKQTPDLTVRGYVGDAKTLLAFNLPKAKAANLAGFTVECRPDGQPPYYLFNTLRFEHPERHAQVASEPSNSSINAPFHKFRWLHVPGSVHQGLKPFFGRYTYVVTPRYFDGNRSMLPLDPARSVSVSLDVGPFSSKKLSLGFTRGYVQSQGFVNHFGLKALIRPDGDELEFDTAKPSGTNAKGETYTFAQEYEWLGFTARERIFELLDDVLARPQTQLDVFAYDLNEPDIVDRLLELARQGRIRIILDNSSLHHSAKTPTPEDRFETRFQDVKHGASALKRGKFGRYSHDKVLIVSSGGQAQRVLTGSTNFSVNGLYINSNHVLVFDDPVVAAKYGQVFQNAWDHEVKLSAHLHSELSAETFKPAGTPKVEITFAPHSEQFATQLLDDVVARIAREGRKGKTTGSVLFAVMELDDTKSTNPVYTALNQLHRKESLFSFGISDNPDGIALYAPGRRRGILVTGKPGPSQLPPPFNQVPGVGKGHQTHHKFIVCGFNGSDPVVYCGSSNLALGGEQKNGDNLLEIHDAGVATAFAIEALGLVDHFQFLDRYAVKSKKKQPKPPASNQGAAAAADWFLSTTDKWTDAYFDTNDLHSVDRRLFA